MMSTVKVIYTFFFLLLLLLTTTTPASAHLDPRDHGGGTGCCGDIPDSLIWLLSFFVLIGFLIIIGSFFMYPSSPADSADQQHVADDLFLHHADTSDDTTTTSNHGVTYVRIDPRDIESIALEINKRLTL